MLELNRNAGAARIGLVVGALVLSWGCTKKTSLEVPIGDKTNQVPAQDGDGALGGKTDAPSSTVPEVKPPIVIIPPGQEQRAPYQSVPDGYSDAQVQQWASAHRAKAGDGYRYIYLSQTVAADKDKANVLRVAIAKAWNHLSWQRDIDIPEDVSNGTGLVFAVKPEKIWGADASANWQFVAKCSPKANISISPAPRGDCKAFDAAQPVLAERFVFNAVNGGPYANVHKTPESYSRFTQKYRLGPIFSTSTQKDAIVCGPRITAYRLAFKDVPRGTALPAYKNAVEALELNRQGKGLIYAYTTDEFDGRDNGDIRYKNAPTGRDQRGTGALKAAPNDDGTAVASEWWIQLPNGFIYFSIHGEGSQERGKGEFPFAIDPANWKQGATLATGRSCITCHIAGTQAARPDAQFDGINGWSSSAELDQLNQYTVKRFMDPMTVLIRSLSDGAGALNDKMTSGTLEPIKSAISVVEGPYKGRNNGSCNSFCKGKFSSKRKNLCETLPAK